MATVQSYTKSGVDAKFDSRSNMTMVHNGGGSPDISAYPDSKTGDVIERSSDGARWGVVASTVNPIAGRVVSVAGKTGVVTLGPGDVKAAPASHTHTKAQITDLNASTSATANSIAQRGTGGVLVVGTPTTTTHAATKAYVDSRITGGITWDNLSGKPPTFQPISHTHSLSQIRDLTLNASAVANTVPIRNQSGLFSVVEPASDSHPTTRGYVDAAVTASKAWSAITDKPSTFTPSSHSHPQAQVAGLPAKLTTLDAAAAKVNSAVSNVSGSTTSGGSLVSLSASGRLTAVDPSGKTDVANKQYVDAEISAKTTWANTSGKPSTFTPSSHTHTVSQITDLTINASAVPDTVPIRNQSGFFSVVEPVSDSHASSKGYVDAAVTAGTSWDNISGKPPTFQPASHTHSVSQIRDLTLSTSAAVDTVPIRNSSGVFSVLEPTSGSHPVPRSYVDRKFESSPLTTLNLNDVTTPGNYYQGQNGDATTDRNYPAGADAGHLVVVTGTAYTKQEYTDYMARTIHYRTRYGSTWYPWQSISQTTV